MRISSRIGIAAVLTVLAAGPTPGGAGRAADGWDAASLGNHRARVRAASAAEAVRVRIPWRRRDAAPAQTAVIVTDSAGARIANAAAVSVGRESGTFVFQPTAGAGDYFFYYMPFRLTGSRNYPNARYREPEKTAEAAWLDRLGPLDEASAARLPEASFVGLESADPFDAFTPMELIATAEETAALRTLAAGRPFLLFPEDRSLSIRMTDDLPAKWAAEGPRPELAGRASRGEFYAFQVGLWACGAALKDVAVSFSDLRADGGAVLPASALRCLNTGGVDWNGEPLRKSVAVEPGKVQALWCGVQVPAEARPGLYRGEVRVAASGAEAQTVRLALTVGDDVLADAGDSDPSRLSRLRWLDSTLASDDEVVRPFTPLTVSGRTIGCLGRTVTLADSGLPGAVRSFFAPDVTRLTDKPKDVLAGPMALVVEGADGRPVEWTFEAPVIGRKAPGRVEWTFRGTAPGLRLEGRAWMEMDGYLEFQVRLAAEAPRPVKDVRLEIPWAAGAARYLMGLGVKGGRRPPQLQWTWDVARKNQDSLWMGDVNAGMQVGLRAENYSRPLNTNFYLRQPLNLPASWGNGGRGSVRVREAGPGTVLYAASGGERTLEPGHDLRFDFILLLTPFKTIDPAAHFATRYMHAYKPPAEAAAAGANVLNIHHASPINPYINYPFLRPAEMKAYIDDAHRRGMRVKIYDTVRELSNRAPEIFALRSLGHEIFTPGPGGGYAWLQEHLGADYIAAWFVPDLKDAAVINSGMSRWHNYYIEGLDWLARNVGIDGLYLDDVAFDRTTMKRVRKVLDRRRPAPQIDLHSANQYNPRDGFVSSATLYLEHFPYLDRLWFGEYFDYEASLADFWLVEVSGLPFGLMGEMLQDGGNPWRGMVFGMTNRMPWSGPSPARLWKVWDEFGLGRARMIGWWTGECPVRADAPGVEATVYAAKGKALIALASWAPGPVRTALAVDWKALGLDPKRVRLRAPEIPDFQLAAVFAPGEPVPLEPGKGWLLIAEER